MPVGALGQPAMPLRARNQFVIKARSAERTHVVPLYVHMRECDLAHFQQYEARGIDYAAVLLSLLDEDAAFRALVQELDNVRTIDELIKTKSNTIGHLTSPLVQAQWFLQDHAHGVVNILQRSRRPRSECFVKKRASNSPARKADDAADAGEEYLGGMYRPLPVRKVAVVVWMYPPHVTIPPTGDRVPANPACAVDFFHSEADE